MSKEQIVELLEECRDALRKSYREVRPGIPLELLSRLDQALSEFNRPDGKEKVNVL